MNDILLIDKPCGYTSHDVVNVIRRQTGCKRVGHTGTLDPLATGLLIILVGRSATKRQSEFLKLDKEYECTGQLGVVSNTFDITGVCEESAGWEELEKISQNDLENVLGQFMGKTQQRVPVFSAVKVHGQKLYNQARSGKIRVDDLPVRDINIFSLELLDFKKDPQHKTIFFSVRVHCNSGTYIRSLVHDIGQTLCVGAVVTALRRTQIGTLSIKDAVALEI